MRDLARFATDDFPLHPSGMAPLVKCPWKAAMKYLFQGDAEESGEAADTGSALHMAAKALHGGKEVPDALQHMIDMQHKYPKADLQDAAGMFLSYSGDTRNRQAKIVLCEEPIEFYIEPAPWDKTQERIKVNGTLDQVREGHHRMGGSDLHMWDLKSSKRQGTDLLNNHTFQAAAYCIGASIKLGKLVKPGGLILSRMYRKDPSNSPVFWEFPWSFDDIEHIMEGVRNAVAAIRNGALYHVPDSENCKWCHAKSPDLCLPHLKRVKLELARG